MLSVTAKIIMRIAFGIDVTGPEDLYVRLAEDTLHAINAATSFGGLVFDFFPFCECRRCFHCEHTTNLIR